jgi:hypothetical protein
MRMELILPSSTRKIPTKGKSSFFPVAGIGTVRVAQGSRVRPGIPRLLDNVITVREEDNVATRAVGSCGHERVEVLLLQVCQP